MKPTRQPLFLLPLLLLLSGCGMPSGGEWFLVAGVALLLFGGAKLPGLMRSMGSGINEFKKGLREGESGNDDEDGPPKKELDGDKKE